MNRPPHEHEVQCRQAIETSMDGYWVTDMEGRLLDVNDAYARRSGYSREELLSMRVGDLDAQESPGDTAAHIQKVFQHGYDRFESVHRGKDGSPWPVEVATSYGPFDGGRLFVFLRDISERKEVERALRESEEFNRRIVASSADCIKVLDFEGNLLSISEGGQRLLEMDDPGRYLGTCWIDFWQQEDRPKVREAIFQAGSGGIGQFQAYCPSERGTPKWWDVLITPIPGGEGKPERLLAVSRDVTHHKQFEDALKAAKAEAERANSAKSRFLASAGHDLRQPFQAMRLFFDVLRDHVSPTGAPALAKLDEAMRAGENLLSALLDVSVLEVGMVKVKHEAFPIDDILAPLVSECAPQAALKGLRLRRVACSAHILSDPLLLTRALRNLLVNAIHYTERGGVVVGCRRRGPGLAIQVCDSGIGIADADLPYLFEEFYQVGNSERDRSKGLGLGLAVVAKTARLLGHGIGVRSVPSHGSTFSVTVPLADGRAA